MQKTVKHYKNVIFTQFLNLGDTVPTPSPIMAKLSMREWTHGQISMLSPFRPKNA